MENKKELYIVKYSRGSYGDWISKDIFITHKKGKATKYVTKFNGIVKKWSEYYSQFETNYSGMNWIKDEYAELYYDRWNMLKEINLCYWEKIEIRR